MQHKEVIKSIKRDRNQTLAAQKKQDLTKEKLDKNAYNLIKWDEFRIRKETILNMHYEAKQQLAMKKFWVYMTSVHNVITTIHEKY